MALASYVPTLSEDGWENSPEKMGDILISHFFISDYSQTQLYTGQVASLPYILQQNQSDLSGLFSDITSVLTRYLSRYLQNVVVEVNQNAQYTKGSFVAINLFVSYMGADGKTYTLTNIIQTLNSKIYNITQLNNEG